MTSVVLGTLSDVVGFLAQSFRLAAVFPAFIFAFLNEVLILPHLPQEGIVVELVALDLSNKFIVAVAFALLLGYTLTIVNIPLIRLFEGYSWRETWYGNWLTELQVGRLQGLKRRISDLEEEIAELDRKASCFEAGDPQREALYQRGKAKKKELKTDRPLYEQTIRDYFPPVTPFLPTALGNTIATFEDYPWTRYKIDAVILWPRLLPTLTKENYAAYIEREKAGFDFVINLSFLFISLGFEMIYVGLIFGQDYASWVIGAGTVMFFAFVFYKTAVIGAYNWGTTVRVAFDLYRYHLLNALYAHPPRDFPGEKEMWKQISQFLREGLDPNGKPKADDMSVLLNYPRIKVQVEAQISAPKKGVG